MWTCWRLSKSWQSWSRTLNPWCSSIRSNLNLTVKARMRPMSNSRWVRDFSFCEPCAVVSAVGSNSKEMRIGWIYPVNMRLSKRGKRLVDNYTAWEWKWHLQHWVSQLYLHWNSTKRLDWSNNDPMVLALSSVRAMVAHGGCLASPLASRWCFKPSGGGVRVVPQNQSISPKAASFAW